MTTVNITEVRHTLYVLDRTGHTELAWNPANTEEVEKVREKFDEIVGAQKYLAYTAPEDGSTGEVIRTFDPETSIILTPQMQGG